MSYLPTTSSRIRKRTDLSMKLIGRSQKRSRKPLPEFSHIAVSGYSGALIGSCVAARLHKDLIVVRKTAGSSHGFMVEINDLWKPGLPYLILDDFINTGATVMRVRKLLSEAQFVCVGVILYRDSNPFRYVSPETRAEIESCCGVYHSAQVE